MADNSITTPICDFLRDYASSGISRFHMPGHKGNPAAQSASSFSLDITEIKGADSLYQAQGIIRESEQNASSIFGTADTLYCTEGSSQCIRAMLMLASTYCRTSTSERPCILAARNVHSTFISAAALLDLDVAWLYPPEENDYTLCSCLIDARQVKDALRQMKESHRRIAAVYLTSPDYLGNLQDIAGIASAAHTYGVPLLVDNAHGAYLHFLDPAQHPVDLGADLCCDSAHKTLPALTGCAYLHISGNAPDFFVKQARKAMAMFGSTSPSYLLLASLDLTNTILAGSWKKQLAKCLRQVEQVKNCIREHGWVLLEDNPSPDAGYTGCEPMKITIRSSAGGYSGEELADLLRIFGIECEYADPDFVVLMPSPSNTSDDFRRLSEAFQSIPQKEVPESTGSGNKTAPRTFRLSHPEMVLRIREAAFASSCIVPVEMAAGCICTETVLSCPPAVPVIVCGERIEASAIPILQYYHIETISILAPGPSAC